MLWRLVRQRVVSMHCAFLRRISRRLSGLSADDRIGQRSLLACPDCHGVMWEIKEGDLTRYRCHIGHAYTAELMSLALDEDLRRALHMGLRAPDERIALSRKLHEQASRDGHTHLTESWRRKLLECEQQAQILRDSIRRFGYLAARGAVVRHDAHFVVHCSLCRSASAGGNSL
jgi:two-component system, chemotaxis family, protein-glutamate methylesterase/glutaminase